jgi:plasmid maintenance system antidote protein VapI
MAPPIMGGSITAIIDSLFGNSPEFWLNAQHSCDLWDSQQRFGKELSQVQPLNTA